MALYGAALVSRTRPDWVREVDTPELSGRINASKVDQVGTFTPDPDNRRGGDI